MSLVDLIGSSPIAALICDPQQVDNPIVECNAAFETLTGYTREEVVGGSCCLLAGDATEPWLAENLRAAIRDRRPILMEILNYKKDGTPFRNAVLVVPIFDETGALLYFLGSLTEIEDPKLGHVARRSNAQKRMALLSRRQREVMVLMAAGQLNKQIAHALNLSERTVKMHKAGLLKALGVTKAADAIRLAIEAGY
ncbi:LuxR C-terminal-related transcriptional regulator [Sphingobium sp. BYY-5]|uniref:LuxR C-terminal-related transcriptional regulator n=1 Tax=Sphingobium sp. BYY-5 TaxID=2926400 RepID=UPI001FA6AFBE|nr:LuxR C-terminal-related transcriptional regulator [Sphingobium sp. BYY-5]MCI4589270.1 LuxR C-terminal-related transcriptional regulator [Sphingobium sp. BYY-5]